MIVFLIALLIIIFFIIRDLRDRDMGCIKQDIPCRKCYLCKSIFSEELRQFYNR